MHILVVAWYYIRENASLRSREDHIDVRENGEMNIVWKRLQYTMFMERNVFMDIH